MGSRPASFINKRLASNSFQTSNLQVPDSTYSQNSQAICFSPPHATTTLHYLRFFFKRGQHLDHLSSISLAIIRVVLTMPPGIYHLPLELVRGVAAECSSRDLAALALTDRHFHAWVNPCLYEHNIKREEADAAVWAAARGRLNTLLLLNQAKTQSSKNFIYKDWGWRARYGPFLARQRPPRSPLRFTLLHLAARG